MDTITFNLVEAAVIREAFQYLIEQDSLSSEEQAIFDKLEALFS
ncbi:hypothetical protein CPT_Pepon004 [Stenotrophomonas phage Pepon]|uniref:Uncharacterized protein n=1 Tax=Stenotrophomonas phage Pepon TaxID=2859654 RepID=A0AAE7WM17_9CAUD|nr:hypothetical protein CPT_Pepon004 [Stenotrophomonas phage Pepon]